MFISSFCCRVTPQDGDTSPSGAPGCSDGLLGATGGAGAMAMPATSTLSLPMSQGKPSLRRIKGRIHRSKSLDSIDLLDSNVSLTRDLITPTYRYTYIQMCVNMTSEVLICSQMAESETSKCLFQKPDLYIFPSCLQQQYFIVLHQI